MKDYHQVQVENSHDKSSPGLGGALAQGQALVEYVLILALVALTFGTALALTGPAISDAFGRTVYSLLGEEPEERVGGGPVDFWLTVTWVAENPPEQRRLPTRTLAPPSATPTEIPVSGNPGDPIDPGNPFPPGVDTPVPTATPQDIVHQAPWRDSSDNPQWYRLGDPPFLGYSDWRGEYFQNLDLSGAPELEAFNSVHYGDAARRVLKFPNPAYNNWANDAVAPVSGWANSNYSIRFTREVYVPVSPTPLSLQFSLSANDGARLWIFPAIDDTTYENAATCPVTCLIINDWASVGPSATSLSYALSPDTRYRFQVDYRQIGGAATLNFDVTASQNPDDQITANSRCNWGLRSTNDANTLTRLWDQRAGEAGRNTICYLELRGYVRVLPTLTSPQFAFWDVWDLGNQQAAWFDVAEYVPVDPVTSPNVLDRDNVVWYRVAVHGGQTLNYNWTRREYDLTSLTGFRVNPDGTLGAQQTLNLAGRNLTFRFGFFNGAEGNALWLVDDIEVVDAAMGPYGATIGLDTEFLLNDTNQRNYFTTTGQWALTSANTAPSVGVSAGGCCSWELNPNALYTKLSESPELPLPSTQRRDQDMRIHYVQLRPTIDVELSTVDQDGDEGPPMLSFWHHYDIGAYVGLEVQYRAPGGEWTVVPGLNPAEPAGRLVDVQQNTNNSLLTGARPLTPIDVTLQYIPETIYQLRFAMLVHRANAVQGGGWWIDNIKLHREDRARFLDYPFFDNAESGTANWVLIGSNWRRTNEQAYSGGHSFAHQPMSAATEEGAYFATVYAFDMNNDTPRPSQDLQSNTGGAAQDPYLTFWQKRQLPEGVNLHVEWRRIDETETDWKSLWTYISGANHVPNVNNRPSQVNMAWEFVEISLESVMDQLPAPATAPFTNDDIIIRFRVQNPTDTSFWYVDDVRLQEYSETSHRLWEGGDGSTFLASPDMPNWATMWRLGGDWRRVTWERQSGIASFHDSIGVSPQIQTNAPGGANPVVNTRVQTYSVLELARIIDLQETPASLNPTLYFWSRTHIGSADKMRVQISYELRPGDVGGNMLNHMNSNNRCAGPAGNPRPQCYEQNWGWSQWYDVRESNQNNSLISNGWNSATTAVIRNNAWQRYQVNLNNIRLGSDTNRVWLVPEGANPGRRIRIRFVMDAFENPSSTRYDGWYLDNISIEPRRDLNIATITDAPFFDNGSDGLINWTGEGLWTLDTTYKLRVKDISTPLGSWTEYLWDTFPDTGTSNTNVSNRLNNFPYPQNPFPASTSSPVRNNIVEIYHSHGELESPYPGLFEKDTNDTGNFRGTYYAGRWVLDTPVISATSDALPGEYVFEARADDGVRIKVEELNATGNVINGTLTWVMGGQNINTDSWRSQGPTTYTGSFNMEAGKRYRVTLEYYQGGGGAFLSLAVVSPTNTNAFGATASTTPPIPYANSSLLLDGTIDLRGTTYPVIEYYTAYELGCNSSLRFEVSNNGGFTWSQNNLQIDDMSPHIQNNTRHPVTDTAGWRLMRHRLNDNAYRNANPGIMIRFRLDRTGADAISVENGCNPNNNNNVYIGAWITNIRIVDAG